MNRKVIATPIKQNINIPNSKIVCELNYANDNRVYKYKDIINYLKKKEK